MKHDPQRETVSLRYQEPRLTTELAAAMILDEGEPIGAALVNFSRHGFRLHVKGHYPAGETFRLEVAGWPRLAGRVIWNDKGRLGCLFAEPPGEKVFKAMCASATGCDRAGF
jgi:hypothetical protein